MGLLDRIRKPPAPASIKTETGRSGTANTRGFLTSDETNLNLQWPRALDVFEEMRKTDPTVRWMLAIVKSPIRAVTWDFLPGGEDDIDLEAAAFAEHALCEELDGGLSGFVRQALLFLDFGHYVFEMVADVRPVDFSFEQQVEHTVEQDPPPPQQGPPKPDGTPGDPIQPPAPPPKTVMRPETREIQREAFVISKLAPRLPRTIVQWNTAIDNTAQLESITQWLPNGDDPVTPEIPADRLVLFVNEREGDDWRGQSVLRPAYKNYQYKKELENIEAIGLERSVGFVVAYPPDDADADDLDAVEQGLLALRQGENVYIIAPGPKQTAQNPGSGWLIEELGVKGDGASGGNTAISQAIMRHEGALARNILAEFMRLGHANVGSRAVGEVQQEPYYQAVESYVAYLEQAISEQVIAPLVAWNYPDAKPPRLKASKIQAKNVETIADALQKLLTAGALNADLELEQWLREILDAPKRKPPEPGEDDGYGKPDVPPTPPPPGSGNGAVPPPAKPANKPKTANTPKSAKPAAYTAPRPFEPKREPVGAERHVAFADIAHTLDTAQDQLQRTLQEAAAPGVARALVDAKGVDSVQLAETLELDHVPLEAPVLAVLERLYREGRAHVVRELDSQREGRTVTFRQEALPEIPSERLRRLKAQAQAIAESVAAAATRTIRAVAFRSLDQPRSPTGPGYDPSATIRSEARGAALGNVSQVFGQGRRDQLDASQDQVEIEIYSALLDGHTCQVCESLDGQESAPGQGISTPNPDCEGGGACRCMEVPVLKSELSAVAYPEGVPDDTALPEAA